MIVKVKLKQLQLGSKKRTSMRHNIGIEGMKIYSIQMYIDRK